MTDYLDQPDRASGLTIIGHGLRRWLQGLGAMLLSVLVLLSVPAAIDHSSQQDHPHLSAFDLSSHIESIIQYYARWYELDPSLLRAVIRVESNFNPFAVSKKGAVGLMQLMPRTAVSLNVSDPLDPRENVRGGARQLRYLLNRFDDNLELALAAYHAGETRVSRYEGIPPFTSTRQYVNKVLHTYSLFQESPSVEN